MEFSLKSEIEKVIKLMGLFIIFGFGIALANIAGIGLSPWSVFHDGLSQTLGISFGDAIRIVGLIIVIGTLPFKIYPGIGTILNMVFIGLYTDMWLYIFADLVIEHFMIQVFLLIISCYLVALMTLLYMQQGLGMGPRDGLSILLSRTFPKLSLGQIKFFIEATVLITGILLGGMIGVGTIIAIVATNYFVDLNISIFKFNPQKIEHRSLTGYYELFKKV